MASSSFPTSLQPAIAHQEISAGSIQDPFAGTPPLAVGTTGTTILPAVYSSNRSLLGEIYDTILSRTGLNSRERQILLAVLPSIPIDKEAQLQCILGLEINMLKALARMYETGLQAARNVGGGSKTSGTGSNKRRSANDTPPDASEATKRPRFELVLRDAPTESPAPESGSALCDEPAALFPVEVEARYTSLLRALDIPNALPLAIPGQPRFDRRHSLATYLLTRQDHTCPITGRRSLSGALVAAHIVPHSIASLKVLADTPYWLLITFVLGTAVRDEVYRIVGGAKSCLPTNGIALDSSIHDMFDKGMIWLRPQLISTFDATSCTHYDVEFRWRGDLTDLEAIGSVLPSNVEEHVETSSGEMHYCRSRLRQIQDGDRFRLFTNDPVTCPLPHPLLLELHSRLWNIIACSGIGTTAKDRKNHEVSIKSGGATPGSGRRARGSRRGSASGSGHGSRKGSHTATPYHPSHGNGGITDNPPPGSGGCTAGLSDEKPLPLKSEFLLFRLRQVVEYQEQYHSESDWADGCGSESESESSGSDCEWFGDEGAEVWRG